MAIKGKSKGRSAKAVTRGPKPVYQPVKKRLIAKREFWLVILSILIGAAAGGFVGALLAVPIAAAGEVVLGGLQAREIPIAQNPVAADREDDGDEDQDRGSDAAGEPDRPRSHP